MRLAFGVAHAGPPLKEPMISALEQDGHHVLDLGTFSSDPVDYPDFARAVGNAVRNGFVDRGILVCGSGVGAAIAANKIRGVRAGLCTAPFTVRPGPPPPRPAPPREEEPPRPRGAPRPAPVVEELPPRPAARVAPERPAAPARPAARPPAPRARDAGPPA